MRQPALHIGIASDNQQRIDIFRKVLTTHSHHILDWVDSNPLGMLESNPQQELNLLLIDISCENLDGPAITKVIIEKYNAEVLLFTNSISHDASKVFEAMGNGALDVITLPNELNGESSELQVLIKKVDNVGKLLQSKLKYQNEANSKNADTTNATPLIAIGSSTGGPTALVKILQKLPLNLKAAIVIVQHVDYQFANTLAHWLDEQVALPVRAAHNRDRPEAGKVLLAATNDHLCMHNDMSLYYQAEPVEYSYRPSVDVFFNSAAQHWKGDILGILLTGMGRDGAIGLHTMRKKGFSTIAQDEQSSIVYGMPKAAIDLNAACKIMDIDTIGVEIIDYLNQLLNNTKSRAG
ncbi:Chemotaxis response regulator protein-glutamate methylesterase CheB [hydrothermal vent metagenome]|uniref:protein-glutamate methylesterase n=1 Tax=hydrothermal vent metagenome TaxID=652676 RepID=A0A3B0YQ22_9ZZZZ